MLKSVKTQCKIMIHQKGFQFSFLLILIYCMISYIYIVHSNILGNNTNPSAQTLYFMSANESYAGNINAPFWKIFAMVFPLIVAFPFSFSYIIDKKTGVNTSILLRVNKIQYYWGKLITSFIGGFAIIFIPFFINMILCLITFPHNHNTYLGIYYFDSYSDLILGTVDSVDTVAKGLAFYKVFLFSPLLYNILYLFILSAFSGVLAMFTDCISYFVKNIKILVMLPPYLLFVLLRTLGTAYNSHSDKFINFNIMDYVGVETILGQSVWLFTIVIGIITLFSIISTTIKARKDVM